MPEASQRPEASRPDTEAERRRRRRRLILCLLTAAALAWLAWVVCFDPVAYGWAPQCPFRLVTGLSCPGCGLQRAVHALCHGHLAEALAYNFFLILALPYLLLVFTAECLLRGPHRDRLMRAVASPTAIGLYVGLYVAWGVVRNVIGI